MSRKKARRRAMCDGREQLTLMQAIEKQLFSDAQPTFYHCEFCEQYHINQSLPGWLGGVIKRGGM